MSRSRYTIVNNDTSPYFITSSVVNWMPLFSNPNIAEIIINSLQFLQNEKRIKLHAYVLMENHLHLIISSPKLSDEIRNFKSYTARQSIDWYQNNNKQWILKQLSFSKKPHKSDQAFQFWQEGFHPKLIQTEVMLNNKLDYIHHNPVKRGFVDKPEDWRYSSYRNFMGMEAVLPIEKLV